MTHTVSAAQARAQFARLVDEAKYRGDSVIIEKNGQPAAALVPLEVLQRYEQAKEDAHRAIVEFRKQVRPTVSPESVEPMLDRLVETVRAQRLAQESQQGQGSEPSAGQSS